MPNRGKNRLDLLAIWPNSGAFEAEIPPDCVPYVKTGEKTPWIPRNGYSRSDGKGPFAPNPTAGKTGVKSLCGILHLRHFYGTLPHCLNHPGQSRTATNTKSAGQDIFQEKYSVRRTSCRAVTFSQLSLYPATYGSWRQSWLLCYRRQ